MEQEHVCLIVPMIGADVVILMFLVLPATIAPKEKRISKRKETSNMPDIITEVLRELWKVTEYKDGAVYKTKYIRDVWVPVTINQRPPKDHLFVAKSSGYVGDTLRTISGNK